MDIKWVASCLLFLAVHISMQTHVPGHLALDAGDDFVLGEMVNLDRSNEVEEDDIWDDEPPPISIEPEAVVTVRCMPGYIHDENGKCQMFVPTTEKNPHRKWEDILRQIRKYGEGNYEGPMHMGKLKKYTPSV